MSDRLQSSAVIPADDVSPDAIVDALHDVVTQLEDSLDRRAEQHLPIAADWNTFRIEAAAVIEANDLQVPKGSIRVQASVAVL